MELKPDELGLSEMKADLRADLARLERKIDEKQASFRRYMVFWVCTVIAGLYLMLRFLPK